MVWAVEWGEEEEGLESVLRIWKRKCHKKTTCCSKVLPVLAPISQPIQ